MTQIPMDFHEEAVYRLRQLYEGRGYSRYKMSKFEEYDLYARNKDFLISDQVITFTDTNGKLMALKPDVTLSIVRNSRDDSDSVQKLYYHESVYRVARGTGSFREITQVGLEALGRIDDYTITEVLLLAAESLRSISPGAILEISHVGILTGLLESMGITGSRKRSVLGCIAGKNRHELAQICREFGADPADIARLESLLTLRGTPAQVIPQLKALCPGEPAMDQLIRILEALEESGVSAMLRFDFSAGSDGRYYNGIVCKGFVPGIPESILSGGQYDRLMEKMHRSSGAIGFAVYLDQLQRLEPARKTYDTEHLLLYGDDASLKQIRRAVEMLETRGGSVLVQRRRPENIRCRYLWQLKNGEVEPLG